MARAIDYARFGRLFLNRGDWNGERIVSEDWVLESTSENGTIPRDIYPDWFGEGCRRIYYNYQWWGYHNCDSTFYFAANGNLGQTIFVIPDKEIIIVHCGNSLEHYSENDLWHVADLIGR
jgi:CubicO group peptidase (beta-lactamase class C family)